MRLTSQTSLLMSCYVVRHVSPECVSVWLFTDETLEFVLSRGKPKFISLPVKFPADRSKFQFCTTTRSKLKIIFTRTVLPCLCFFSKSSGQNNAKYAFNTLLKITPHNMQKRRRRKEEQSRDLHDDIRGGLPIQFLTPPDRA